MERLRKKIDTAKRALKTLQELLEKGVEKCPTEA